MNSKAIKPEKEKLKSLFGFLVSKFNHALSAARRSAGSAARYWATVEAVMLATIPAELTDDVDEEDMPDFQAKIVVGFPHRLLLTGAILCGDVFRRDVLIDVWSAVVLQETRTTHPLLSSFLATR
jgi:hypothetical protein